MKMTPTHLNLTKNISSNIASFQRCARINRPGIYTNISALSDWIRVNTKDGDCSKYI